MKTTAILAIAIVAVPAFAHPVFEPRNVEGAEQQLVSREPHHHFHIDGAKVASVAGKVAEVGLDILSHFFRRRDLSSVPLSTGELYNGLVTRSFDALETRDFDNELEVRDFDEELEARDLDDELEARDFDDELEARDFDEELEARDFDDELEARDFDDELEARDFEDDLEVRDFDDELEARGWDELD